MRKQLPRNPRQLLLMEKNRMKFYNLDAIIFVSYRINFIRETQFRQWATKVLKTFIVQGYVLDKKRLENGQIFSESMRQKAED